MARKIARVALWTSQGAANQVDPAELLQMIETDDKEAKRCAIKAFEQHPPDVAIGALARLLQDEDAAIRAAAVGSLGKFGDSAAGFSEQLADMAAKDKDARVQALARWALKQVSPK